MEEIGVISFVGTGKMATAITRGLLKNGFPKDRIKAFDISDAASQKYAEQTGIKTSAMLSEAIGKSDIVIVAVKPQDVRELLSHVSELVRNKLLISVAAGVPIRTLIGCSNCRKVVRCMPNTPALIGCGASAFACSDAVSADEACKVESIFNSVGIAYEVEESLLNAVTGLSGSGPAYVFDLILGLADGGVNAGLPRALALHLAAQTVYGAAKMVLDTDSHPAELRDQVTSPGGTTARGLAKLESFGFRGTLNQAVMAATERARELSEL
jgi:pyrroline-5-carboxylate reductase